TPHTGCPASPRSPGPGRPLTSPGTPAPRTAAWPNRGPVQARTRAAAAYRGRYMNDRSKTTRGSGSVTGGLLYLHPHHHADRTGPVFAGIPAVVLPGKLRVDPSAHVPRHRHLAAQLDVVLRVGRIDDADADPRVPHHVPVLDAPLHRGEQQVAAVAADPYHRGLRAAVGVHRGQHRVVLAVDQAQRRFA